MRPFLRKSRNRLKRFFNRHKLPLALVISISVALVMTAISVYMYASSGVSQLDLSRPGYESFRGQVDYNDSRQVFDDEGPINRQTVDEFLILFKERTDELKNISDFSGQSLDDATLDLAPTPTATTTTTQ